MKKRGLIFSCLFLVSLLTQAQTGIYKTYEDFLKGNLEKMDDDIKLSESSLGFTIKFTSPDGNKVKYSPKENWGFLFKGSLFRSDDRGDVVFVLDTVKLCSYENGTGHLRMLMNDTKYGSFLQGYSSYLSLDLKSKIYPMPFLCDGCRNGNGVASRKYYRDFMDEYPQFQSLYDCIDKTALYRLARPCIVEYHKSKKK